MLIDPPNPSLQAPPSSHATFSLQTPMFERRTTDRPTTIHKTLGRWALQLTRDPFKNTVRCRLSSHRVTVENAAVILQAPTRTNTFDAYYRLDAAAAVSWRVNAMELVAHGVAIEQESLSNPSGGRVAIPLRLAGSAQSITIRPSDRGRSFVFSLRWLDNAISQAKAMGCGSDFAPGEA